MQHGLASAERRKWGLSLRRGGEIMPISVEDLTRVDMPELCRDTAAAGGTAARCTHAHRATHIDSDGRTVIESPKLIMIYS